MRSFGYLIRPGNQPEPLLTVIRGRLVELVRPLLLKVEVDEEWYSKTYADVRQAIAAGDWKTGRDHWLADGYFEDRMPHNIEVNEAWYLDEYSDVEAAVRFGDFQTAQQHFFRSGYSEGRFPYAGWNLIPVDRGAVGSRSRRSLSPAHAG